MWLLADWTVDFSALVVVTSKLGVRRVEIVGRLVRFASGFGYGSGSGFGFGFGFGFTLLPS